jgi:hypothetical protein
VWRWISGLLANPDKVRAGIEAMIDQEREGAYRDPNRESRAWQEKLAEADRMRSNHQEMAVKGFMIFTESRGRLEELENTRTTATREFTNPSAP